MRSLRHNELPISYPLPIQSCQPFSYFLSEHIERQTDRQTDMGLEMRGQKK